LGHTTGVPNDRDGQRSIVSQGLAAGVAMTTPAFHELDFQFVDDEWKADPLGWSRKRQNRRSENNEAPKIDGTTASSGDSRTGRSSDPVWQTEADAEAAAAVNWDEQCLVCIGLPQDARPNTASASG
jgi:hypothetical protein